MLDQPRSEQRVTTGLGALDDVLGGLYWGDNVVWQLDSAPAEPFYEAIARLPEFEALRDIGKAIKDHTIAHLDYYLELYEKNVVATGGVVHWARDAAEARAAVLEICRSVGAKTVTKGKSMIGEEIAINDHLERAGITPVETDLGEYIIQLRH